MPRKKVEYDPSQGKPWLKFIAKLNSYKDLATEEWNEYQLMGYFVDQLKEKCDLDFMQILTYEGEPKRHPQMRIMRNIIAALSQMNKSDPYYSKTELMPCKGQYQPTKIKKYIDWSLERVKRMKKTIFSLNYLLREKDINSFLAQSNKINRSDKLSEQLKQILPTCLSTYGDLSFFAQSGELSAQVLQQIEDLGVDVCMIV